MSRDKASAGVPPFDDATSTSQSLLVRLRQGDADAWNRIVSLYTPLVKYWCRKLHLADQEIPDVVQDIFQSVAAKLDQFRKEQSTDTFRGWLRTITHNKVVDHHRRQARQPRAAGGTAAWRRLTELADTPVEDDAEAEQIGGSLYRRALDLIRTDFEENTWRAFWGTVVEGRSTEDVAEELSMRPGTVRVAKSRVLHRLRQELGESVD